MTLLARMSQTTHKTVLSLQAERMAQNHCEKHICPSIGMKLKSAQRTFFFTKVLIT